MNLSNEQLQVFKKSQTLAQSHCESIGAKLLHPINFDLLELDQEKQKVELDKQTMKDIQKQVKQAIEDGLESAFK